MRPQRGLAWWMNGYETVEGGFDRYRGQYGSEAKANETAAMTAAMATLTLTWKASSTGGGKKEGAPAAAAAVVGGFPEVNCNGWARWVHGLERGLWEGGMVNGRCKG